MYICILKANAFKLSITDITLTPAKPSLGFGQDSGIAQSFSSLTFWRLNGVARGIVSLEEPGVCTSGACES